MGNGESVASPPAVSVIVPARNEEASLGACLQSLAAQKDVALEILVVDDGSEDRTREIALSFPEVRLIDPGPVPPGWTGKNHAVWAGARQARGRWLLFTDADTIHLPGSLAASLSEAQSNGAALLSYSPGQEVRGFWEKAIMPVVFAELASAYPPSQVSDSKSPLAAANGQYLLISREAYDATGGHAAIASSLLEDVALARAVKASGRKIFFRYGGDAVRTRMYRSFRQLQEGWTKNLALLFPSPAGLAALRLVEFGFIGGSATVAMIAAAKRATLPAVLGAAFAALWFGSFYQRIRKAHFSASANLLALTGLPLFSYLLLRSKLFHQQERVTWKGRVYGSSGSGSLTKNSVPGCSESRSARVRAI